MKIVEIILAISKLIHKPLKEPRKHWEAAFQKMHRENDDQLLLNDVFDNETFEESKSSHARM